ncbi:MAG: tetraacyldisaccharide 4'-kinase [Opitutae bacterium]|nr:tetraacyldisaccharide 4'-kinase [Opitutae bacterium]
MSQNSGNWLEQKWSEFEGFVEGVIYDRDLSVSARLFGLFLKPFSFLFSGIVRVRLFCYTHGFILKVKQVDCLVIVVGNLTVGGTGKTPVVERFTKELMARGRRVAILSRGYKSKEGKPARKWYQLFSKAVFQPPKIVSDGENVLLDSDEAGDEPYMLAKNLKGAVVLADKDRVKSGLFAIEKFKVNTLILDDGFQYLPIKGNLNLLLVDQTNPFGNRCLLPRGILREPVRHLSRASYVFLTKSEIEPDLELLQTIRKYNSNVEIIRCAHRVRYFQEVNTIQTKPLNFLYELYVGVFCGIASPRGFEDIIQRMSGEMRFKQRFLDHHRYTHEELDRLFLQAKNAGADVIVTTEKDAVRIPANYKPILPFYYVRMEIEIIEGFEDFEDAVADICFPERKRKGYQPLPIDHNA